jgi:xanthine dehydrogenase YagR molybdenum-binding subunit
MMEPHASIAAWEGDKLTLWTSNQMIAWASAISRRRSASRRRRSAWISPFIGGGFGGKLFLRADAFAGSSGRPYSEAAGQGRADAAAHGEQHDAPAGDDPAHPHRGDRDGKITAIGHESMVRQPAGRRPETLRTRRVFSMPAPTG